jgi:hypothetical protein
MGTNISNHTVGFSRLVLATWYHFDGIAHQIDSTNTVCHCVCATNG